MADEVEGAKFCMVQAFMDSAFKGEAEAFDEVFRIGIFRNVACNEKCNVCLREIRVDGGGKGFCHVSALSEIFVEDKAELVAGDGAILLLEVDEADYLVRFFQFKGVVFLCLDYACVQFDI